MSEPQNENVLKIGFSLGSLLDTSGVEKIYKENGLKAYVEALQEMDKNGEVFKPGPALGFCLAFKKLNNVIPNEVLDIKIGLITKNSPNPEFSSVLFKSCRKWFSDFLGEDIGSLDFSSFTNGNDVTGSYLGHGAELAFTTSPQAAAELYKSGIPAINIPNQGPEKNAQLFSDKKKRIVFVSDYDGVIGDTSSEKVYQDAKKNKELNPVQVFRDHESLKKDLPMELGPLGKVIKKLSRIVKHYEEKKLNNSDLSEKLPFENIVVTARGGDAMDRFLTTVKKHEICISQFHFMDGYSKNNPLANIVKENQDANIFFMDDGGVHYTRAQELENIIAGWVATDMNREEQLKEQKKEKDRSLKTQELINKNTVQKKEISSIRRRGPK